MQNYTQPINFGISSYELPQWLNAVFVQDRIHLRPTSPSTSGSGTTSRTLTDANNDFAPRIGFAWNPEATRAR